MGSYFEGGSRSLKTNEEFEIPLTARRNRQRDAVDVNPSQYVLHCRHNGEWGAVAYVGHEQPSEAHCKIYGKQKMGYQSSTDFAFAQLDTTDVWKGNWGAVAGQVSGNNRVADEQGFQPGAAAERVQNGLDCNTPAMSVCFQNQVYEVRGSQLTDGGGILGNE